jgi:hypothetical protein
MNANNSKLERQIKQWLWFFIVSLVVSGVTAFPVETELKWLLGIWNREEGVIYEWLQKVYTAVKDTNEKYPFIAYGYDWLAFAHLVIAVAFIGPLKNPVRNIWIIEFGMIACVLIFPLAFIAGYIRQIPIGWTLIDCSFGVVGIIPLKICHKKIKQLEKQIIYNI